MLYLSNTISTHWIFSKLSFFLSRTQVKLNREKHYNYSSAGYYFITICTKDRESFFGKIAYDKMILNECGEIALKYWLEIPEHFPNAKIGEFVVMPNHFHGIVIIEPNPVRSGENENRQHQKLPVPYNNNTKTTE